MTRLFACVRSAAEAEQVAAAGFDGIFADDPALQPGALAMLCPAGGVAPDDPCMLVGPPDTSDPSGPRILHRFDAPPAAPVLDRVAAAGTAGILLAPPGRLLDRLGIAEVGAITALCAARGLLCALSGGLEAPDVPRLLAFGPDLIVVGQALRAQTGALDPALLALLRDLVPREDGRGSPGLMSATPAIRHTPDRIFLRDLVLSIAIGAYATERGRRQRVRFSVEAELIPTGRLTRDMRDVVSYDLFSDAIAALTTNRHVDFVETLAEDIAAEVLGHPRILLVRVTVEKLDVGPGAVGVSIERRKEGRP